MDFMERIHFTEKKEANDNQVSQDKSTSLMEIAKEMGLARLIAAGLIGCAAFYGFIWAVTLLWIGLGAVL